MSRGRVGLSVQVLLATYNGSEYINELFSSLALQTFNDFSVAVRDDKSTDNTLDVIRENFSHYPELMGSVAVNSHKLGPAMNFLSLISEVDADYVLLCDQDDVWLPSKIEKTLKKVKEMEKLHGVDMPVLVHTDLVVVDSDLNKISESFWEYQNIRPSRGEGVNRIIAQNVVTGCTATFNRALLRLIQELPINSLIMHDWLLAIVASSAGKIEHIDEPTVLYRQHKSNKIGAQGWGLRFIIDRIAQYRHIKPRFKKVRDQLQIVIRYLKESIPKENSLFLEKYIDVFAKGSFFRRLEFVIKNRIFMQGTIRNIGYFMFL